MRKGILITRGAILEHTPGDPGRGGWSIAVPLETSVLEVSALMSAFGLYCEMEEGALELRLLPMNFAVPPDAAALARFYEGGSKLAPEHLRFIGVDFGAAEGDRHVGPR